MKGVEAPASGGRGRFGDAPHALTGGKAARYGPIGSCEAEVAAVVAIAAQALPGYLLIVQCQNVLVGRLGWRPVDSKRGPLGCHDSTARVDGTG